MAEAAAALLAQMALLRPTTLEPVHSWAFAAAAPVTWLADEVFPPALRCSDDIAAAARSVAVPKAAGRVCRFSFEELCSSSLSAADYLALCSAFDAFVVDGVPAERSDDELRRFVTLLDCLYDNGKLLALSAARPLPQLFEAEVRVAADPAACALGMRPTVDADALHVSGDGGSSGRSTTMIGGIEWSATGRSGASLAHLGRGAGSFAAAAAPRAASRLAQMTSRAWAQAWAQRHAPPASWTQLGA